MKFGPYACEGGLRTWLFLLVPFVLNAGSAAFQYSQILQVQYACGTCVHLNWPSVLAQNVYVEFLGISLRAERAWKGSGFWMGVAPDFDGGISHTFRLQPAR